MAATWWNRKYEPHRILNFCVEFHANFVELFLENAWGGGAQQELSRDPARTDLLSRASIMHLRSGIYKIRITANIFATI
jgi:hypothetical protein